MQTMNQMKKKGCGMGMGLTERHWFENEEPELTERQLEDIVYENKKAYDSGYVKGFHDAKTLEEYFVEFGVKIGFLTPEKAEQLLKEHPQIVRCKDCACALFKESVVQEGNILCTKPFTVRWQTVKPNDWYCADGVRR